MNSYKLDNVNFEGILPDEASLESATFEELARMKEKIDNKLKLLSYRHKLYNNAASKANFTENNNRFAGFHFAN